MKKKIVISTLGALEPWALSQRNIKKKIAWHLFQRKILNNVDYIHATSQMESENLINLGIKSPIKVLPHGLEISENEHKFREKPKYKAIFFSRIHQKKGLLELIRSWSKIDPSNWELDIYGPVSDDNYLRKIKKEIKTYKNSQSIKIFDPVYIKEKKFQILSNSDLFILPSKSENFGMSILEALSLGVPVLTTYSTPWKILNSLNAGFVIEFSEQNILNALNNIIKMKHEELNTVGNNGKEFVKKNYNIKNLIKNYINFYNGIHK